MLVKFQSIAFLKLGMPRPKHLVIATFDSKFVRFSSHSVFALFTNPPLTTSHLFIPSFILFIIHDPSFPSPFLANICPLSLPKNMKILRLTVQIYLIRKIFVFFAEKPFTFTPPPSFPFPITLSTHAISFVKLLSNGDGERFRGNI